MDRGEIRLSRRAAAGVVARTLAGGAIALAVGLGAMSAASADGGTLRVRFGSDIGNLDPARIFQVENQTVAGHVFNGLVKYDQATNEIVPDLAREWSVSADGLTYEFKLRQGVEFHKGYGPLTADDVKFSLERVLDPATKSRYAGQLAGVKSVDAPDPSTVRITLEKPNAGLLNKVTAFNQGWIMSRKAVAEIGDDKVALNPIGTGPFVFEKWTPGSEVRLSANKSYFEGAPKIDAVVFKVIKDETAAAIALENGEIDIFFALQSPVVIDRLRKAASITVLDRPANHTINLVLNTSIKPLDDVRVRRAIAYGVNRKALIDGFFKGTKGMGHSVLTSSFPQYSEDVPQYPYDPEKAKALLAEAGVGDFTLDLVSVGFSPYDQIVVPIASDLNKVGIKTNIKVLERGAYLQARGKGDIMTCVTGVVGPPDPDSPLVSLYATQSFPPGLNTSRYDKADDLLARAATEQDADKRTGIYRDLLKQTMSDVPVLPLYADRLFLAHTAKVEGLVQNSLFTVLTYSVSLKN
ncbi:MAG: ABC transporter substrate-binding protein [Ectothiorhodospiraceae bacterium]|nr:ABC transporter substrate-binding protein [Planctomycetota bacterium]MCP5151769.1 ABC transporter substrate-binding protein [Chromatiales bacterium]MCP5154300.1 ABC transporter substrate-binding protein [Ectothiorhodospiraceae bacterium]